MPGSKGGIESLLLLFAPLFTVFPLNVSCSDLVFITCASVLYSFVSIFDGTKKMMIVHWPNTEEEKLQLLSHISI